ncbi:MAG: sigma 54-interacting transcriptional regulator [Myxococcales bacterium]|nr:sigma 54-interacting transcriptional regulator [Myxococcales bacterium]
MFLAHDRNPPSEPRGGEVAPASDPRSFLVADARVTTLTPAVLALEVPVSAREALLDHFHRRAKGRGHAVAIGIADAATPAFAQIAAQLEGAPQRAAAAELAEFVARTSMVVVVSVGEHTWDWAVVQELAGRALRGPVLVLHDRGAPSVEGVESLELGDPPTAADRQAWFLALAEACPTLAWHELSTASLGRPRVELHGKDPWTLGRAARDLLEHGDLERADALHAEALSSMVDAAARRALRARWGEALRRQPSEARLPLVLREIDRALRAMEIGEARTWLDGLESTDPRVAPLLARCLCEQGDLVSARSVLGRAVGRDDDENARLAVELARLAQAEGDAETAEREATRALGMALSPRSGSAVADAHNVLGKLLLAQGRFEDAERRFAEDALTAEAQGLVDAALSARVNRAIAAMSRGAPLEAEQILAQVLVEAERGNHARPWVYALDNLAVLAWRRQDFGAVLSLLERSIRQRTALGDREGTVHPIASLAELRLRLGQAEHAHHLVRIGRRTASRPTHGAHFALVAARVAIARRDHAVAGLEVQHAIAEARRARDKECAGTALLLAARLALDEGDLDTAEQRLEEASASLGPDGLVEASVVRVLWARAAGRDHLHLAREAVRRAREHRDEEWLEHALLLHCAALVEAGTPVEARGVAEQALMLRARVEATLPADVRAAYLSRSPLQALVELATELVTTGRAPVAAREARPLPAGRREPALVGEHPTMRRLRSAIDKLAASEGTVLVRGESGTGKELVARALHQASARSNRPLVSVNCAALVESLLLSELFGHEKGAFTGAVNRRRGRFELAEGGILFLDEIGDISPRTQVALLRVLQEKTFERVGGATSLTADVRIVCATHRNLEEMVARREFREDLYYRISGLSVTVPSLRERRSDLPKLAESLLARLARERGAAPKTVDASALELLRRYDWPGNVRELDNVLRSAAVFAEGDTIDSATLTESFPKLAALPPPPPHPASTPPPDSGHTEGSDPTVVAYASVRDGEALPELKRRIERECIARALAESDQNITAAARILGMKRPRLSQLVKQHGLAR